MAVAPYTAPAMKGRFSRLGIGLERAAQIVAWSLMALITVFTLEPLGDRPRLTPDPQLERALAFTILGALYAVGYPRRPLVVLAGVLVVSSGLEAAQLLTPDRHGHVRDALAKACGGVVGMCIGLLISHRLGERDGDGRLGKA